jgi:hypothetical protein
VRPPGEVVSTRPHPPAQAPARPPLRGSAPRTGISLLHLLIISIWISDGTIAIRCCLHPSDGGLTRALPAESQQILQLFNQL